jgi:hypothetical protein
MTIKAGLMEIVLPASIPVTLGAVAAFISIIATVVGIYFRLRGQLEGVQRQIDKMALRNERADHETEEVKREQAAQKTTVAVMSEQISGISRTLERIDRNVEGLVKGSQQ